jgi:hypothetical protein
MPRFLPDFFFLLIVNWMLMGPLAVGLLAIGFFAFLGLCTYFAATGRGAYSLRLLLAAVVATAGYVIVCLIGAVLMYLNVFHTVGEEAGWKLLISICGIATVVWLILFVSGVRLAYFAQRQKLQEMKASSSRSPFRLAYHGFALLALAAAGYVAYMLIPALHSSRQLARQLLHTKITRLEDAAGNELVRRGPSAAPAIIEALNEVPMARWKIAVWEEPNLTAGLRLLARMGSPEATDALRRWMHEDISSRYKLTAATGLIEARACTSEDFAYMREFVAIQEVDPAWRASLILHFANQYDTNGLGYAETLANDMLAAGASKRELQHCALALKTVGTAAATDLADRIARYANDTLADEQ